MLTASRNSPFLVMHRGTGRRPDVLRGGNNGHPGTCKHDPKCGLQTFGTYQIVRNDERRCGRAIGANGARPALRTCSVPAFNSVSPTPALLTDASAYSSRSLLHGRQLRLQSDKSHYRTCRTGVRDISSHTYAIAASIYTICKSADLIPRLAPPHKKAPAVAGGGLFSDRGSPRGRSRTGGLVCPGVTRWCAAP